MKTKILIIGYGAMGMYLVPELSARGYQVDVYCMEQVKDSFEGVTFHQANAFEEGFLKNLLETGGYDAAVDFLMYATAEKFRKYYRLFLDNVRHYIFLSTYRIYANEEHPVKETSPRLLEVIQDPEYQATEDEYSRYKALEENVLRESGYRNFSIIRPAITYSKYRFQLVTLEAQVVIERARKGKKIILPEKAMDVQATMSWAGDVAKMIAGLLLNPAAMGETFSVCTAEHHTWREVAEYYKEITGMDYVTVDTETYYQLWADSKYARYQLEYDRFFDRIMDNSKILTLTGLKQEELMPLKEGLRREFEALPEGYTWPATPVNDRMDAWLEAHGE